MSANGSIMVADSEDEDSCVRDVMGVFPDICPDYMRALAEKHQFHAPTVIGIIADQEEDGKPYRKRARRNTLKRKRDDGDIDEAEVLRLQSKYNSAKRRAQSASFSRVEKVEALLKADFYFIEGKLIEDALAESNHLLLPTYLTLFQTVLDEDVGASPWMPLYMKDEIKKKDAPKDVEADAAEVPGSASDDLTEELRCARAVCLARVRRSLAKKAHEQAEERNYQEAKDQGKVSECECCFAEYALNRLVHCDSETAHLFCKDCTRRHAEIQIGLSKHELQCLSMDQCHAGFSVAERRKFLDNKLMAALDRIENEDALRLANLEGLSSCPFCPYAAIYPPVEVDKEFRCQNPECEIVSCRLCNGKTHIPKSCEELEADKGYAARRKIEEAMSTALIRKCNKCGTPFIKESGCNKMTCTRLGCGNIQCYVCSGSCGYNHFDDSSRGGKAGNCPLFDNNFERHKRDVEKAERETREQVLKEDPGLDPDFLKIKTQGSDDAKHDNPRREARQAAVNRIRAARARQFAQPLNPVAAPRAQVARYPSPQARPVSQHALQPLQFQLQPMGEAYGFLGHPAAPANLGPVMAQMNQNINQNMNQNRDRNILGGHPILGMQGLVDGRNNMVLSPFVPIPAPIQQLNRGQHLIEQHQQAWGRVDGLMAQRAGLGGAAIGEAATERVMAEMVMMQALGNRIHLNKQAARPGRGQAINRQQGQNPARLSMTLYPAGAANQQ